MGNKRFRLDEETKKKMMGLVPITSDFTVDFTPEVFKDFPVEIQPVFTLKPWNNKEIKEVAKVGEDDTKAMLAIAKQIVGWKNVIVLPTEDELVYEPDPKGGVKVELLERIPTKVSVAILTELGRISGAN